MSMKLLEQLRVNASAGPYYESDDNDIPLPSRLPVRVIAFYLPQFHAIPENDRWWGKGFTEWANVTKAVPRYVGHYQPRLPGDLGFYDLRLVDNLRQQAALAKRHGIAGFCFHYYWFGGHRLLDTPLNILLANPDIDLPFFVNWANENWTRRWDGGNEKILIRQSHSAADDIALARAWEPLIRDRRYMRINNRPIIMLYRPGHLPDPRATIDRWRQYFTVRGLGNPYMVMPQVYGEDNPHHFGMDAAAGFPPHKVGWDLPSVTKRLDLIDPNFGGKVMSYDEMARCAIDLQPTEYRLFHGVCPNWDNEARRTGIGWSFIGSTPEKYGMWLAEACHKALDGGDPDERIVFVNAWNEWAEGAYLEPDRHYGFAFLRETARVLAKRVLSADSQREHNAFVRLGENEQKVFRGDRPWSLRKARLKVAGATHRLARAIRPDE